MKKVETKSFEAPDEVRSFNNGKLELVNVNGKMIGKATFNPGWKWSNDVKPSAKTQTCQMTHFGYQISGTMRVKFEDGTEFDTKAGGVGHISPGHDAWVVGNEPVVIIDFQGMVYYSKK